MPCYAFGPFRLEPSERRLWREECLVDIGPKAFDVLVALVERAGHLVPKDELMAAAWPGSVVEENALTVQISKLRAALGESAREWRYVETVPRGGYRFAHAVREIAPDATDERPSAPKRRLGAWPTRRPVFRAAALVAVVATLTLALNGRGERDAALPSLSARLGLASHTDRAAAQEAYDRGRSQWWTRSDLNKALWDFRQAAVLDSSFALAHVGKADVHAMGYQTGDESRASLRRALAIDPTLGEAHATLGLVRMLQDWDWDGAEAALARARTLTPEYVPAHQWTATLHMIRGEPDRALVSLDRALALAPAEARPALLADRCQALYLDRRFEAAAAACRRALDHDPPVQFAAQTGFWSLALAGRGDDAAWWAGTHFKFWEEALTRDPASDYTGPGGRDRLARALLAQSAAMKDPWLIYTKARVAAFAGEDARALDLFEEMVEVRHFHAPFLAVDPVFDGLRGAPRFQAAVRRIGLPLTEVREP